MDMEGTSRLKIFTGTAHPALAKEISDYIGVPLGKSLCGRFNNGERLFHHPADRFTGKR